MEAAASEPCRPAFFARPFEIHSIFTQLHTPAFSKVTMVLFPQIQVRVTLHAPAMPKAVKPNGDNSKYIHIYINTHTFEQLRMQSRAGSARPALVKH